MTGLELEHRSQAGNLRLVRSKKRNTEWAVLGEDVDFGEYVDERKVHL